MGAFSHFSRAKYLYAMHTSYLFYSTPFVTIIKDDLSVDKKGRLLLPVFGHFASQKK